MRKRRSKASGDPREVGSSAAARGRARAALAVKIAHSVLVLVMGAACVTVLVDGVTGRRDVWLWLSLAMIGVEGVVYVVNGRRCPLTKLARRLGDASGHDWLFERLLPEAYVVRVAPFFAWVTLLGLLAFAFRWLMRVPA
jgi:hypothetical protein